MKKTLVIAILSSWLAACSTRGEPLLSRMEGMVGKGTQEQFLQQWGSPLSKSRNHQGEIWLYRHMALQFDRDGILRSYYAHPH